MATSFWTDGLITLFHLTSTRLVIHGILCSCVVFAVATDSVHVPVNLRYGTNYIMQAFAKLLGHSQSKNMADGFAAASATGSASGASGAPSAGGGGSGSNASAVPLPAASDAAYSPSAASSSGAHPQPKVEPIAHLPTVLPAPPPGLLGTHGTRPPPGHLLDVTPSYIVYSVKNGLVRVLDRGDGSKTLLRGHTAKVGDVAFFSAETAGVGAASGADFRFQSDAARRAWRRLSNGTEVNSRPPGFRTR